MTNSSFSLCDAVLKLRCEGAPISSGLHSAGWHISCGLLTGMSGTNISGICGGSIFFPTQLVRPCMAIRPCRHVSSALWSDWFTLLRQYLACQSRTTMDRASVDPKYKGGSICMAAASAAIDRGECRLMSCLVQLPFNRFYNRVRLRQRWP